jgi:hypothetical protein
MGCCAGPFVRRRRCRRLRVLCRRRADLVCEGASHLQQAQKALVQMNVQLHLVVSDINGETGLCIIDAILGGQRDPAALATLRDPRIKKSTVPQMEAGLAAGQTDTWLGRFYRRKRAHLGAPKAITATAHKLACVIYHMLKYQEEFLPLDVAIYDIKAQEHRMRHLRKQAQELGFELVARKDAA